MVKKRGPVQLPRAERFWQRVNKTSGCWLWTGTTLKLRGGYGTFYDDDQRLRRAHRVAYELTYGVDMNDPNVALRHTCDNPPCVRPDHLTPGTQTANMEDMRQKERDSPPPHSHGEDRYNAKLSDSAVRQMRRRHRDGESITAIARDVGVSRPCAGYAINRLTWAHVVD
jgi:hypothetical protein